MPDDNSPAKPYEEDCEHLQGLLPDFASQADVVLCVKNTDHSIGFPVHRLIVSGHSTILSQMLENLQPVADETVQRQLPSLLMMDDSCSAVRSALACMYRSFPTSGSRSQAKSQEISLECVPDHALHMRLYDKYNMARIAEIQTEAFMELLRQCLSITDLSNNSAGHILQCAAAAEECGLGAMLALCEVIVMKHFPLFDSCRELLTSKLPSTSVLRIYDSRMKLQQKILDKTAAALEQSTIEIKALLRTLHDVRYSNPPCKCTSCCKGIKCPRCHNALIPSDGHFIGSLQHERNCGCSRSCTWPDHTIP